MGQSTNCQFQHGHHQPIHYTVVEPLSLIGSLSPVSNHSPMASLLYFVSLNTPRFSFYSLTMKPALSPAANSNNLLNSYSRSQKNRQPSFVCDFYVNRSKRTRMSLCNQSFIVSSYQEFVHCSAEEGDHYSFVFIYREVR